MQSNFSDGGIEQYGVIEVVIDSSEGQVTISTSVKSQFLEVANLFCEMIGWDKSETRFTLDGDRLQDDLTMLQNDIGNGTEINAFKEMLGGKGPDNDEILRMLEQCDANADADDGETSDLDDVDESSLQRDPGQILYEELKLKLKEGKLKLDKGNDHDKKLCFLLETDNLQPYELIRLRNVYSFWEQSKPLREEISKLKTKSSKATEKESKKKQKRINENSSDHLQDDATPNKRKKLLEAHDLKTPSPLMKRSQVNETEMKQLSVSVHLWADHKMGGVTFLQKVRLNDSHFEDILQFTGSNSKWNLMKSRTLPQLRKLWRNTLGDKHHFRGHSETGFENEIQVHSPSEPYCPFGHCSSGFISPIDLDIMRLTPKKILTLGSEDKRKLSSRQLFGYEENQTDKDDSIINEETLFGAGASSDCASIVSSLNERSADLNVEGTIPSNEEVAEDTSQNKLAMVPGDVKQVEKPKEEEPNYVCKICSKVFQTFSGFERHNSDKHNSKEKVDSACPVCMKRVIYLDQHMRAKHSKQQKNIVCEICLQEVSVNMQKHRKDCIRCRFCDYVNSKKARLLNHIEKCPFKTTSNVFKSVEFEPLDLRSPLKKVNVEEKNNHENVQEESSTMSIGLLAHEPLKPVVASGSVISDPDSEMCDKKRAKRYENCQRKTVQEKDDLEKARKKYAFDTETSEEDYYSEIDMDDTELFTVERRKNKDNLELKLREVDLLTNTTIEGDDILVDQFTNFMRNKYQKESKGEGYSKQTEPTTINLYSDVVRKDILKAVQKLISPFDARWLVDCKTQKLCQFEGEERLHVNPNEPIYMTSRILQEALKHTQTQKKRVIAAFNQLMEFIELHFTLKLNAFGVDVLTKVQSYHKGVKSFIKATSQWKNSKEEERNSYEKNKLIKEFECPNKDAEVLEKYKKYIKSNERIMKINKLLSYAHPDAENPTAGVMTDLGITVMEEIVAATGCRPKVVRHLNMAAYGDAKPGFNPYDITGEEATLEEDVAGEEIWRRVNPNRPPKEKACIHQIQHKSAHCSENCGNQCIPEGYNFWITWDKTQSTKGPYFLHIPTPIKDLMDRYDLVRSRYFKEKKPSFAKDENWLEDEETPVFLNSACNSFPSLDLKKLSDTFGIDVTGYSFRKIVVTWALNHKSAEIRSAEEEALNHSLKVAKDRYMQNKQTTPQNLVQTYVQEENLYPERFRNEINKGKSDIDIIIAERQKKRTKHRISKLMIQHEVSRKTRFSNRPLGLRNSILEADRSEFVQMCEEVTGSDIETLLTTLKPLQWRNFIVRMTCSTSEELGEKLRNLWIKFYRGDLQFGIREERNRAKQDNWPLRKQNPGRKDRNSWIAHGLRKSCLAAQKFKNIKK